MAFMSTSYVQFSNYLESIEHNNVHSTIAGMMLTNPSPKDPIFWSLHANIDRMWDNVAKTIAC